MRTDEERDECIDRLLKKIGELENEITQIKGGRYNRQRTPVQRNVQQEALQTSAQSAKEKQRIFKSSDSSLENAIGTRWIGRIGIVAIIFGVSFFLKYSFDNKLIGETGRVILGIFFGLSFLGTGEYLQKKKHLGLYGQMVSGGGLAILYLAFYSAFALYHLLPSLLAAVCMLAVTTTGMTLSIRYSAYPLVAIAVLGGFLTPIMLSTGQNQPVTLFSYVLLLDAGVLCLMRFRHWPSLVLASLAGTLFLYFGWHFQYFSKDQQWLALFVVTVFFIFYNMYVVSIRNYGRMQQTWIDQMLIFGSAGFVFIAMFAQNNWEPTITMKISVPALALCEICIAMIMQLQERPTRLVTASYAAVSVTMTVVSIFVILGQRWTLPALTAQMAALAWIGLAVGFPGVRTGAYLLGVISLFKYAADVTLYLEPFEGYSPILNERFFTCALAIGCFYFVLKCLHKYRDRLGSTKSVELTTVFMITQILTLVLFSFELHDYFRFRSSNHYFALVSFQYEYRLSLSVLWGLYASLLIGFGILRRMFVARIFGILLLGITILKVFFLDLSYLQTFYRIISFIALGLLLLAVSYGYNRFKHIIFGENQ